MSQSVEFRIQDSEFYAYYVLSEDQKRNLLLVKVKKGSNRPTKQQYTEARKKAFELLNNGRIT